MTSCSQSETFSIAEFETRTGTELYKYIEHLFSTNPVPLSSETAAALMSRLPSYHSVEHVVQALDLAASQAPELAANLLPDYLSDPSMNVRLAAGRAVAAIPNSAISIRQCAAILGAIDRGSGNAVSEEVRQRLSSLLADQLRLHQDREKETGTVTN